MQTIFDRHISRPTHSRHQSVRRHRKVSSLFVDQKHARISQYHEEAHALRTETVINDTCDFNVSTPLKHLEDLRSIGFTANRHLLRLQRFSPDCATGAERFHHVTGPV